MNSLKILENSSGNVLNKIPQIIGIGAGKGGVGKSTVTVNLALGLKKKNFKVGVLDADIYGPSLAQMFPEGMDPSENLSTPEKIFPALTLGIPYISVAHFKREASIIRAPIANQIIEQFLYTVDWGELDFLLIDFPPGTGDIQLTLMQKTPLTGALVVTTPQIVSTIDVRKAIQLFKKMEIPVLGVVENMSYFTPPNSNEKFTPFGVGGGINLAKEFHLPFLGEIPIDSEVTRCGDEGTSLLDSGENSLAAKGFMDLSERVLEEIKNLTQEVFEVKEGTDPYHLELKIEKEWIKINLTELQNHCPCAHCSGKQKSEKIVSLLEFSRIGRYALKVQFSSGCSQGIYPLSLIKKIGKS